MPTRKPEIEIEQDDAFQRRDWRAQRIGWGLLAAAAALALLGVFGGGGISSRTTRTAGGAAELSYQRFLHHHTAGALELRIAASALPGAGPLRIRINQVYAAALAIDEVQPMPETVSAAGDWMIYQFSLADRTTATAVSFDLKPEGMGPRHGRIVVEGAGEIAFDQYVYP